MGEEIKISGKMTTEQGRRKIWQAGRQGKIFRLNIIPHCETNQGLKKRTLTALEGRRFDKISNGVGIAVSTGKQQADMKGAFCRQVCPTQPISKDSGTRPRGGNSRYHR